MLKRRSNYDKSIELGFGKLASDTGQCSRPYEQSISCAHTIDSVVCHSITITHAVTLIRLPIAADDLSTHALGRPLEQIVPSAHTKYFEVDTGTEATAGVSPGSSSAFVVPSGLLSVTVHYRKDASDRL